MIIRKGRGDPVPHTHPVPTPAARQETLPPPSITTPHQPQLSPPVRISQHYAAPFQAPRSLAQVSVS